MARKRKVNATEPKAPKVPLRPSSIAMALDYDFGAIRDFAGEMLEAANDHDVALALWSINYGDPELACDFIKASAERDKAGYLTTELMDRRAELLKRYTELQRAHGIDVPPFPES